MASASSPSPSGAGADPGERYRGRLDELRSEGGRLDDQDRSLSRMRGITFLLAAGLGLAGLFAPTRGLWAGAAAAFAAFLVFVVRHALVSTRQFELERRVRWCEQALARLDGSYRSDDPVRRGDALRSDDHPYSGDLDVFGPASLYEQLNTTQTPAGSAKLAGWLLAPADPATIAARQAAARELGGAERLREQMALEGMRAGKIDKDATPFLRWARAPAEFARRGPALVIAAVALVAVTLVLAALHSAIEAPWTRAWMATLGAQIALLLALRARLEPVLEPIAVKQSPLGTYHGLLALAETQAWSDPTLRAIQGELKPAGGISASAAMRRLERLAGLAAIRHNALVYILADVFLLWDVWCAYLLDRWRKRHGAEVDRWLEALSELEALAALATFADEHPDYAWPEVDEGGARFVAAQLGHPLIVEQQRVVNDVALDEATRALMITGSNMSGKSTMLRSMGVAAVLAQAGAPVCASKLVMSPLRVMTSMRVGDALDRGASRFYMEVRKLKKIVDASRAEGAPLMFLLDEVLHGTNSRERIIGAKAVVTYLVERGAIGAVSSHDLGLVELEALTEGRVRNVHFEDHLEDGLMAFDYRMKPGPVGTSNALRLMRGVGIDVPGLEADEPRLPLARGGPGR